MTTGIEWTYKMARGFLCYWTLMLMPAAITPSGLFLWLTERAGFYIYCDDFQLWRQAKKAEVSE